jgi:hypothetical protein
VAVVLQLRLLVLLLSAGGCFSAALWGAPAGLPVLMCHQECMHMPAVLPVLPVPLAQGSALQQLQQMVHLLFHPALRPCLSVLPAACVLPAGQPVLE